MRIKAAFFVLTLAALGACDSATTPVVVRPDVAVTVTPSTSSLTVGQTTTLVASVANDTTGTLSGVTWSSSSAVATVTASGVVTAVAPGTATITATSKFMTTKTAATIVTVAAVIPNSSGVTITPPTLSVNVGQTAQFIGQAGTAGVTYSSSATAVATVDANTGMATAVAPGTSVITATSKLNTTAKATAVLTVNIPAPFTLAVLGSGAVNERYSAEIAAGNGFAYTTTWSTRSGNRGDAVKIWNVSGASPTLVDSLKIAGVGTTSDVQISADGSLLVVSTEGLGTGSIVIYNRSNPALPTFVARHQTIETMRGVHTVKLSVINNRHYAFLQIDPGTLNGQFRVATLVIVDITNPTATQEVFVREMGRPYIHDVFVRDGLLFAALWDDGMTIFDVGGGGRGGSPSNPVTISNVRTVTGDIHNIAWIHDPQTGSKKYVFLGEEGPSSGGIGAGGAASGDIHVMDITDIAAPREVAIFAVPGAGVHNFFVDEPSGILYAAYYNAGVRAIDVRGDLGTCTTAQRSTKLSVTGAPLCDLRLMGREAGIGLATGGFYIWGVTLQGTRLYASDMAKGIVTLDASPLKR